MKSDFEFQKVTLDNGQECLEDKPLHDSTMVVRRTLKPEVEAAKAKAKAKKLKAVEIGDLIALEAINKKEHSPKSPMGIE
jgi:hypothetical protein